MFKWFIIWFKKDFFLGGGSRKNVTMCATFLCSAVWISITITCVCDVIIKAGMCGKSIILSNTSWENFSLLFKPTAQLKFGAKPPTNKQKTKTNFFAIK